MISYIQYTNPAAYPPLQHSSRIFAKAGKKVLFLGTGSSGKSDKFEFPPHENIKVRRWKYLKAGLLQKIHYICFSIWASMFSWASGAKWIYASDMFSCPAALIAQKIFQLKVIYHEHDSPALNFEKKNITGRIQSYFRNIVGRNADIVIFPNEARANLFRQQTGRKGPIQIVWNVPSLDEINLSNNLKPAHPILFYHGSLNEKRLPISVLEALQILDPGFELTFAGYSAGLSYDYGEWYISEAKKRGLDKRVKYLGAIIDRGSLLAACSKASVGLAFMPSITDDINMMHMTGASNKPFDYLACGLKLIVSDLPDWKHFYVNPKVAVSCNPESPVSIAQAVNQLFENNLENSFLEKKIKVLLLAEWNYENQFHNIYQRVVE